MSLWLPATVPPGAHEKRINQIRKIARAWIPGKIVDLGTGTGELSVRLSADGATMTCVDSTDRRVLAQARDMFVQEDAVGFDLSPFDLVIMAGLFYHLDLSQQQQIVSQCRGKYCVLDTHFSRSPAAMQGSWSGQFRSPTASTTSLNPFVHTIPSLRIIWATHRLVEVDDRVTPDRQVFLGVPR